MTITYIIFVYWVYNIIASVVVRLPRPMEGNGVTPIFRSLQNCQFQNRSTTVSHFWTIWMQSNDCAAPTDTNLKNLEVAPPQSITDTRLDQFVYSPNYYIQIFRLKLLPAVRIESSTARSKLKSNALPDCAMGAIYPSF